MNDFTEKVIEKFSSDKNCKFLYNRIKDYFLNSPETCHDAKNKVAAFLRDNFKKNAVHFIERIKEEMLMSDPLTGVSYLEQVKCLNTEFIIDRIEFIKENVLEKTVQSFRVDDQHATFRNNNQLSMTPDCLLNKWKNSSGRNIQLREDRGGDNSTYGQRQKYSQSALTSGIEFCDQSSLNTQNHVDQFYTSYMGGLNGDPNSYENTPFGVSTPASDARLLSRRIFRNNEDGVENGIPNYEKRLYNRNLEKDIGEGLQSSEIDNFHYKHDVSSLHERIDHKNKIRKKIYNNYC